MKTPQPGILPEPNAHALFLVLAISEARAAATALAGCQLLAERVAAIDPSARLVMNVGLGASLWDRLSIGVRPRLLRSFRPTGKAPATGGDVFLHIASARHDLDFDLARRLLRAFGSEARVLEEVHGFRHLEGRDLIGFIDGTENPHGPERADVALVGDEDEAFAGGSYVSTQRYVHDLDAFGRLPDPAQEAVIGRTKPDSIELPENTKPATAHISRVVVEEDGEELEILRHSYPYGTVREAGLFFVAYARTPERFEIMLSRMMGVSGDGLSDALMGFTRAVSGASFFVPSLDMLGDLR